MARPKKSGLDYFPFDVDFFNDEKIVAIAGEFGIKGEITAIKLLCAIYRNGYFIEWSEMMQMKMLKSLPGISVQLLNQIVLRLVKWGFFDQTLFDSVSILSSIGIQRRFFHSVKRRNIDNDLPFLLIETDEIGVNVDNNPVNAELMLTKTPQIKEKKIIKKTSTVVDVKEKPSSSSFSIEKEVEVLKNEEKWLSGLQVLHHTDVATLKIKLDEFKLQCLADGKDCHKSLADAKKHFNAWLRIKNNNQQQQTNERIKQNTNLRRGAEVNATRAEDYKTSF